MKFGVVGSKHSTIISVIRKNRQLKMNDNLVFRKIPYAEKERLRLRRSSSISFKTRGSSARSSIERRSTNRSGHKRRTPKKQDSLSGNDVISKRIDSTTHINERETENKPSATNEVYQILDNPQESRPSSNVHNKYDPDYDKCVGNQDNSDVCNENIPASQENVSIVDNAGCNKTMKKVYQPLQGPLTAYSVRMYKKLHGVSPPKLPSIIIENKNGSVNNELFKSKLTIVNNEVPVTQNVEPLCKQQLQCITPQETTSNKVLEEKVHVTELSQVLSKDKLVPKTPQPNMLEPSEFSKSHYKRLHDVRSPKLPLKLNTASKKEGNSISLSKTQINTNSQNIIERVNHAACEVKAPNITLKLQEEVKEYIKLGANINNKKSPHTVNNVKQTSSPIKKEMLINRSPEQLIIQCDLRQQNTPNEKCNTSQNVVSINETIGNIIKNQKAGMYNSSGKSRPDSAELPSHDINVVTPNTVKSKNSNRIKNSKKPAKKISVRKQNGCCKPNSIIKKDSKKPVIAPVTFGNRICSELPLFKKGGTYSTFNKYLEQMKCSKSITSHPDNTELDNKHSLKTLPPKLTEDIVSSRKFKVLTSLFGESPMKLVNENDNSSVPENKVTKNDEKVSPTSLRDSPILPDSPSLDSDSTEDLVIDTTACIHNKSLHVSESDKKDELDNSHNLQTHSIPIKNTEINTKNLDIKKSEDFQTIKGNITVQEDDQEIINKHNIVGNVNDINNMHVKESSLCNENKVKIQMTSDAEYVSNKFLSNSDIKGVVDTYKSSASNDLGKAISPEISIESVQSISEECKEGNVDHSNDNKNKSSSHTRFVPSPPQLTLVSAFRHSENSVFTIAEDTLGFVSALTRVRDISPIRTPDKSIKKKPEVQIIPESEDIEPKIDCFIISTKPDITNPTEFKTITRSSVINNTDLKKSFEINSNQNTKLEKELIDNKNNGTNDKIIEMQKKTACANNNRFRRSRPVRQLTVSQPSSASKLGNKENINFDVVSSPMLLTKNELNIQEINKNETPKMSVINVLPDTEFKSKLDQSSDDIVEYPNCKDVCKTQPNILFNNIPATTKHSLSFATASINDNETIKTYKRSESLKMLKQTPKVNKAIKVDNEMCENLELENKLNLVSQPKVEIRVNQLTKNISQYVDNEKEELNKLPHIASINQRIRVSKYQGGKDKPVNILAAEVDVVNNMLKNSNGKIQNPSRISMENVPALHHKNQEMSSVQTNSSDLNNHKNNLLPPHSKSPKSNKYSLQSSIKENFKKPIFDDKAKIGDAATMLSSSTNIFKSSPGAISKSINKSKSAVMVHECKEQHQQPNHKFLTNQHTIPLNKSAEANINLSLSPQNKTSAINNEKNFSSSRINKSMCKSPMTSNNTSLMKTPEKSHISIKNTNRRSQSSSPESRHKSHGRSSSKRYRSPRRRSRYRSKRSKSMSPHFVKQRRFTSRYDCYYNRGDRRIRQYRKRSRSRSHEHYRSKSSGNSSKQCITYRESDSKKSSDNICDLKQQNKSKLTEIESVTIPLDYAEEIKQLKEELSIVKTQLKEKDKTQEYMLKTPCITEQTGVKRQLETLSNDHPEFTKRIKMTYDNEEPNQHVKQLESLPNYQSKFTKQIKMTYDNEESKQHVIKDLNMPNNCNKDIEDKKCVKELNTSITLPKESPINLETSINSTPVKVIKLKRRSRNLGDSEVKVVSFDSCGPSITKNRTNLSIG